MGERQRGIRFEAGPGIIARNIAQFSQISPSTVISKGRFLRRTRFIGEYTSYILPKVRNNAGVRFVAANNMIIARVFIQFMGYPSRGLNERSDPLQISIKKGLENNVYSNDLPEIARIAPAFSRLLVSRYVVPNLNSVIMPTSIVLEPGDQLFADILSLPSYPGRGGMEVFLDYYSG